MSRERKFVASVDPQLDQTSAKDGCDIVLFSNCKELRMLSFWEDHWNFTLHQSVITATGRESHDPDFIYHGEGYVDASWAGGSIPDVDTDWHQWNEMYKEMKEPVPTTIGAPRRMKCGRICNQTNCSYSS